MDSQNSKLLKDHMFRIDLDLAGNCNRRCSFCPRSGDYPNVDEYMSIEIVREVIDRMREISFDGWIELAGRGEPTLNPDFEEIVRLLTPKDRTWKGTDHAASLEPSGLSKLTRDLRAVHEALNFKTNEILPIESVQREKLKNRK